MPSLQYKKEYNKLLVEHGKQGRSYSTFAAVVGVSRETLYDWEKKFPKFKEAKRKSFAAAQDFLEKLMIMKMTGQKKDIDVTLVIFALKTRFHEDYGDKQKLVVEPDEKLSNILTLNYDRNKKKPIQD